MELVEARGAAQQPPVARTAPTQKTIGPKCPVTRGQKHQPGSNMPACFLCSAEKENHCIVASA